MTRWRGIIVCSVIFFVAACTSSILADSQTEAEDNICEAVFRHQFEHNASGAQQNIVYYFLSLGEDKDPSPEFLARFAGHKPQVEPVSAATTSASEGVQHKKTSEKGLIFRVTKIRWVDNKTAEVEGGYYEAGLSASGNTYRVEWQNGRWVVTNNIMHWIS